MTNFVINKLTLNLDNGQLFINNICFNYNNETEYLKTIKKCNIYEEKMIVNGYHKYGGFDIIFCENKFAVEFVFKDGKLYSNSLIYYGLCSQHEFGATEYDQKKDRLKLRGDFKKGLGKPPDKKLKNRDLFVYD